MKILWLCNVAPSAVEEKRSGKKGSGLWMDQMLTQLRQLGMEMRVLCPGREKEDGIVDPGCSYHCFRTRLAHEYCPEQEGDFEQQLKEFQPDVIHIWGTEYSHTLAMMRACRKLELLDSTVVSIQGLCSVYAGHYCEGVPYRIQKKYTLRDFIRRDNMIQQARKFSIRGAHELEALQMAKHVIGRTRWDKVCTGQIQPQRQYHFCNETLREPFYEGQWCWGTCQKHRIFASSSAYPVKGMHYLLQAMVQVVKTYPDAVLAVPGKNLMAARSFPGKQKQTAYQRFLVQMIRRYGLEDHVEFLGKLTAEEMKEQYLRANVFALPSTIENSPNSLGEAMLLGVPCAAADVGGVTTMMTPEQEGFVYQSTAPYMLAGCIENVFAMGEQAEQLGLRARSHARITHDPDTNLRTLLEIYRSLGR